MAKLITVASLLLVAIGLTVGRPCECGIFGMSKEDLTKKLADKKLEPDDTFKLIKKGANIKVNSELKLNGLGMQDLLGLNPADGKFKMADCEQNIVSDRVGKFELAEQQTEAGDNFASVRNYCKDRVASLLGYCAKNLEDIIERRLLDVQADHLDVIRSVVMKRIFEREQDYNLIIEEYLANDKIDKTVEKKHADLNESCEHLTKAFTPVKVILDHEDQFGVEHTEMDTAPGWMIAYRMCEHYLAHHKA